VKVAGADVWKGRWVFVVLDSGRFERAFIASHFDQALDALSEMAAIGVDIPIGLPPMGKARPADIRARKYVGPRWQSVFLASPAPLMMATTHAEANEIARSNGWAGIWGRQEPPAPPTCSTPP
jgi:predicted RNase H-like nuclease